MSNRNTPPPLSLPPVSPAAEGPLYEQIIRRLRHEIARGRVGPNAPLPSFRQLARDLMVSVITVKRAYEELEREGLIYRRQGLGTFVADQGAEHLRRAARQRVEELLTEAAREAAESGFDQKEWNEWTDRFWKKTGKSRQ